MQFLDDVGRSFGSVDAFDRLSHPCFHLLEDDVGLLDDDRYIVFGTVEQNERFLVLVEQERVVEQTGTDE
ncbi:hypothetical protein D3C81_1888020 [compost metagenome]